MPKLPVLSGAHMVKAFQQDGWVVARQRGSHVILVKEGHPATLAVPQHREVAPGTLRSLVRAAGLSVEQFVRLTELCRPGVAVAGTAGPTWAPAARSSTA